MKAKLVTGLAAQLAAAIGPDPAHQQGAAQSFWMPIHVRHF
jgi:hypothetical protein